MATSTSTTRSPITTAGSALLGLDLAADRPGTGDQMDAAVGLDRHRRPDPLAEGGATLLGERHAVAGRRRLAAEKRRPVVVEVLEDGRHVDGEDPDLRQARRLEELDERPGARALESPSLVELERGRIEGDR